MPDSYKYLACLVNDDEGDVASITYHDNFKDADAAATGMWAQSPQRFKQTGYVYKQLLSAFANKPHVVSVYSGKDDTLVTRFVPSADRWWEAMKLAFPELAEKFLIVEPKEVPPGYNPSLPYANAVLRNAGELLTLSFVEIDPTF